MVRYAREHGVKPAARAFNTTPRTVGKWLSRWEPGSLRGLEDRRQGPNNRRYDLNKTETGTDESAPVMIRA